MNDGDHINETESVGAVADAVVSVRVAAEPGQTWAEHCDARALQRWFWPTTFETVVESDPVVGGAWSIRSAPADMGVAGRYLVVDRPRFIRMSWVWDGEAEATTVTIALEPGGQASAAYRDTVVTVRHSGHLSEAGRVNHEQGWHDCLARLVARYR